MIQPTPPKFHWLERGDGEPVLLLHGLMGHMDHWDAALARHVRRFLDALDITRAVVGGNSLGGQVALELALAHPERVSGLILTGFFDPSMVTDHGVESVRRTVTTRFSALASLEAPALLVWGRNDRVTPPRVAERFHALIPRSELVFVPLCGHAAMLEQPEAFNSIVRHWLVETRPLREALMSEASGR